MHSPIYFESTCSARPPPNTTLRRVARLYLEEILTTEAVALADAEIRNLERIRYDAVKNQDFETFSELCHPDLVYTHSNGERDSLQSYLHKCRTGTYIYHRIEHPVERVVVTGDVAVVVGQMHADITASGKEVRLTNSSLAVWVRVDGAWKLLAYQPTVLPAD